MRIACAAAAFAFAALVLVEARVCEASPSREDIDSARAHYKRGVELYEQGSYTEALAELGRANQLAPTYKLLYNLALVQMRLGDWAGSKRSLDSYLGGGGAEISAARRAEVEHFLADVTAHLAMVAITANVEGAQVAIDDVIVGATPLPSPIPVNPGPHHIAATKPGMTSASTDLDLATGARLDVPLTLTEPAPPVALAPPPAPEPTVELPATPPAARSASSLAVTDIPPAPAPEHAKTKSPTWVGWLVTGTFAAGSLATGIAALSESHTLGNELATPTSGATLHSTHATTVSLALASDILGAAALVAGGVTLYFALTPSPSATGVARGGSGIPAGVSAVARF